MNEVISHLSKIMMRMPHFLDRNLEEDSILFIEMMILNNILIDLIDGKVQKKTDVYKKWLDFQDQYQLVLNYPSKLKEVNEYYYEIIDYITEICIEEELYESAANIKKFNNFK